MTENIKDLIKKICLNSDAKDKINYNNCCSFSDTLYAQATSTIMGIINKTMEDFLKSDPNKELNELYAYSSLNEKTDYLIHDAMMKSAVSGASAAVGMTSLIPVFISGFGAPAALSSEITLQLAEIAYLIKTQVNLILHIAYINGIKFEKNNQDDMIKLISVAYGIKFTGKFRDILIKEIMPKFVSKILKKEIFSLPPFINIVTIPLYNALSTYYVGLAAKKIYLNPENSMDILIEYMDNITTELSKLNYDNISFSEFNKL